VKANVHHLLLLKLDSTIQLVYGAGIKNNDEKRILCLHYRYSMKAKIVKRLSTDVLKNICIVFNEN